MTLDEAIAHALEVAGEQQERADSAELIDILCGLDVEACKECASDHRQLAEWLTDYKELKTKYSDVQEKIREIRGYLEFAEEHMNVMGVLEALDIIKDLR